MKKELSAKKERNYSIYSIPSPWRAAAENAMDELSDQKKAEKVYAYLEKRSEVILLDRYGRKMFSRSVDSLPYFPLNHLLVITQDAGVNIKGKDGSSNNSNVRAHSLFSLGGRLEELAREVDGIKLVSRKDYVGELRAHGRLNQVADYCLRNY
ncbi:MAG: hypothetical protein V2A62_01595 [Candidatus Woesearchaeota archaeon]